MKRRSLLTLGLASTATAQGLRQARSEEGAKQYCSACGAAVTGKQKRYTVLPSGGGSTAGLVVFCSNELCRVMIGIGETVATRARRAME